MLTFDPQGNHFRYTLVLNEKPAYLHKKPAHFDENTPAFLGFN